MAVARQDASQAQLDLLLLDASDARVLAAKASLAQAANYCANNKTHHKQEIE